MARDHAFTLSTKSLRAIAANFVARDKRAQRRIKALVRETSERLWEDVFTDTPKDTWFMASHLRHRLTEKGLGYEVGWDEEDFTEAGLEFYPVYVIWGTRTMPGRDVLFSNRDRHDREFRARLRAELSDAIARGRR